MTLLETYFDLAQCEADQDRFAKMVKTWGNPKRWGIRRDDITEDGISAWRLVLVDRGEDKGK